MKKRAKSEAPKFKCRNDGCPKAFKTKRTLVYHVNFECGKPPRFKCSLCSYDSWERSKIQRHAEKYHIGEEVSTIQLWNHSTQGIFGCPNTNCDRVYYSQGELNRHITYECVKRRSYKCPHCPYCSHSCKNTRKHINDSHPDDESRMLTIDLN